MRLTTILRRGLLLALFACPTGCAIQVTLPVDFLELEKTSAQVKATSADDAIFWIERVWLPKKGQQRQFWVDALKRDFVDNRGYLLLAEEPTTTTTGVEGTQMLFETTTSGETYRYLVAVFFSPGHNWWLTETPNLHVARFVATLDTFARYLDPIKDSIRSLRL